MTACDDSPQVCLAALRGSFERVAPLLSIRNITPWEETSISHTSLPRLNRRSPPHLSNITRAAPVPITQPRVCRAANIPTAPRHLNVFCTPHRPCTPRKPISSTRSNCRKISFDNDYVFVGFNCTTKIKPVNISTIISIVKQVIRNSRAARRPVDSIDRCRGRRNRKQPRPERRSSLRTK